jgi:hypothetical protein
MFPCDRKSPNRFVYSCACPKSGFSNSADGEQRGRTRKDLQWLTFAGLPQKAVGPGHVWPDLGKSCLARGTTDNLVALSRDIKLDRVIVALPHLAEERLT